MLNVTSNSKNRQADGNFLFGIIIIPDGSVVSAFPHYRRLPFRHGHNLGASKWVESVREMKLSFVFLSLFLFFFVVTIVKPFRKPRTLLNAAATNFGVF